MTSEFIRQKTSARGSLTPAEREKVDELLRLCAKRSARTTPINRAKIIRAITAIYKAAGLKRPHIAIAASPLALAFAYGAALAAWDARNARIKLSLDCEKPDPVLAALKRMTTVIARGDDGNKVTDAGPEKRKGGPIDVHQVIDKVQDETHLALGSEPYEGFRDRIEYRDSTLYKEITDRFRFRAAWTGDWSLTQAVSSITSRRISVRRARALRHALEGSSDVKFGAAAASGKAVHARMPVPSGDLAAARRLHRFVRQPSVDEIELLTAQACHAVAGRQGRMAAKGWLSVREHSDWELSDLVTLTVFRDVLGLKLPSHKILAHWEQAAMEGGMRVVHEEFCIICDFPEVLKLDERNRPHCADGPSYRWRDGWALYYWHGTRIPQSWIEDKTSLTAPIAVTVRSVEQRRAAMEIVGWHNVLRELKGRVVAKDPDPQHGRLVDVWLPGARKLSRFLHVKCPTGREFAVGINRRYRTVKGAHAWLTGLPTRKFKFPTVRT